MAGPSDSSLQSLNQRQAKSCFQFNRIKEDEVLCLLKKLNTRKATGVDGISSHLLRTLAQAITPSITILFNASVSSGKVPTEWKMANVTPIQKKPGTNFVTNYRPISVIPFIAKVYESLIHRQLYSYLSENSILHPSQSEFRPGRTTQDVLLKTVDDWRIALDCGEHIGAVLIDLSKAFDSIDHALLLKKLQSYGVEGNEFNWFTNYLTSRKQRVSLDLDWANVS